MTPKILPVFKIARAGNRDGLYLVDRILLCDENNVLLRQLLSEMVPDEGLIGICVRAAEARDTPVESEFYK